MKKIKKIRLIEFFLVGVILGVLEDLIAIMVAVDSKFEWRFVLVAILVAIPFAFISEIVVDHPDFWKKVLPTKWIEDNFEK